MKREWAGILLLFCVWTIPRPAEAQFSGAAFYEVGGAATDVGEEPGNAGLAYGFGAGSSYSFLSDKRVGVVVGVDLLIRAFGLSLPGISERDAGVFDQTDLIANEIVALRTRRLLAGLYLEQRRIDRGGALGTVGFPASAVGFVVAFPLTSGDRTAIQFSYARFQSGRLRLGGSAVEPEIDSGRSVRLSARHYFSSRWGLRGEYSDIELTLEDIGPTFTFFDHRQRTVSLGALLSF